jgi:hypothetical protein
LNEKSKAMLAKIRIYRTSKEPMIQKLYRIQQGLSAASDIQYYQLQNVLPRKYLPSDDEMQLMENLR